MKKRIIALGIVLVLGLTACSSDGDTDDTGTTTATTTATTVAP